MLFNKLGLYNSDVNSITLATFTLTQFNSTSAQEQLKNWTWMGVEPKRTVPCQDCLTEQDQLSLVWLFSECNWFHDCGNSFQSHKWTCELCKLSQKAIIASSFDLFDLWMKVDGSWIDKEEHSVNNAFADEGTQVLLETSPTGRPTATAC